MDQPLAYPPVKKPDATTTPEPPAQKPWKGDKPGVMGKSIGGKGKGALKGTMKFRPLAYKRPPGRPRKRPRDERFVQYF